MYYIKIGNVPLTWIQHTFRNIRKEKKGISLDV